MSGAVAVLRHFPLLDVGILEVLEYDTLEGMLACFFLFLAQHKTPGFHQGSKSSTILAS